MKTIEVKTSELEGAALDWAVGIAVDGKCIDCHGPIPFWTFPTLDAAVWAGNVDIGIIDRYQPSTDWSQGGPLIEKYGIGVAKFFEPIDGPVMVGMEWAALWIDDSVRMDGPTPLIAACRAIVAAKLGDVVQVPADLIGGAA